MSVCIVCQNREAELPQRALQRCHIRRECEKRIVTTAIYNECNRQLIADSNNFEIKTAFLRGSTCLHMNINQMSNRRGRQHCEPPTGRRRVVEHHSLSLSLSLSLTLFIHSISFSVSFCFSGEEIPAILSQIAGNATKQQQMK